MNLLEIYIYAYKNMLEDMYQLFYNAYIWETEMGSGREIRGYSRKTLTFYFIYFCVITLGIQ